MDDPHLSTINEGVETTLDVLGRDVRVVVPADALQDAFGARAAPESWLTAFEENSMQTEKAARRAQQSTGQSTVILAAF